MRGIRWLLGGLLGLAAVACGGRPRAAEPDPATSLPPLPNASRYLDIPTYDGSGQPMHPDVVYFPRGWRGYRYWMAMTPYPYDSDTREDPSVVASNDGLHWEVPPGLTNPLVPTPACDHNSDPDLVYDPDADALLLFFTQQQRRSRCGAVNENRLLLMRSSDGVHWTAPRVVLRWNLDTSPLYLSPAVVYRDGTFHLWLASQTAGVAHATSADGVQWSPLEPVSIDALPWHLDVEYVSELSRFWMLFVDSPSAGSRLKLATSDDGVQWAVREQPLLEPGRGWDADRIYRATFVYEEGPRLRVWYSARSRGGQWHTGYTWSGASATATSS
ncbi:MAG TPA: hypothetical protein VNM43_09335 [Dehalococcoidia bacterium]|nr:hypothetical protein [Dehalococcoidia bacterium]